MSNVPTKIGRYQILGLLGTGGMAEVLLGRLEGPSGFERPVVIKRILPHLSRELHFVDMFLDEARIVAGIHHQNVVNVHELCRVDDELFMVMEYLEGESAAGLARRLSMKRKLLSFGLCTHVLADICAGLHAAHTMKDLDGKPQHLVHRDVSPANIFITYTVDVKILDFVIAVAIDRTSKTEAGQVKGKYAYMSPEQCQGKPLDRRSDIFSLGTVLYELSTCRRLFKRTTDMLTLEAICSEDVVAPSKLVNNYPAELERIALKALQRDRNDRYQTALEMRRDLLALSQELNRGKVPEVSLAKVMHKLFEDRIDQKRSLLTRIHAGDNVTSVPVAETDASVELPNVALSDDGPDSDSAISLPDISHPGFPPRRRGWLFGAIAAAAAVIIATGLLTAGNSKDAGADTVPPAPVVEAPPKPPEPAEPEEAVKVSVRVETDPPGAIVKIDGKVLGLTPTYLLLPKGEEAVDVLLSLEGHEPRTEKVVPDVDQKFSLALAVIAETPEPEITAEAPPPPPPPRRRARRAKKSPPSAPPPEVREAPKDEDPYSRFD
ncbi:MAG: serine/threonine-protein kinase [Deltaproteobacteria bacterium]